MSSQIEPQEVNVKSVQKRRIRSDTQNRDYKCPCGKSYLSYPALYTHIKQKHPENINQLKKPGGINKPQSAELPRGRPKVVKQTYQREQQNIQYAALSVTQLLIVELVEIFKEMEEFKNKAMIQIDNNVLLLEDVREELRPFNLNVQYLLNEDLSFPKKPSCMKELAIYFVFVLQKHFSAYVYARIVVFFHIFILSYQQKYPQSNGEIQHQFFNEFITELYRQGKSQFGVSLWEEKPKIMLKVLGAFGNWMHVYGFINHKVQLS